MPTEGNFQDYVVQSGDTLFHKGAALQVGTTSASTLTFGLSNSAGMLAVVAAPTGNATLSLPNGGTLLTNVNVSAGTTSQNLSAFVLSNSNNVSFGLNGSTVTASATVASTQGSFNLSAGTTSNLASAFTFSNSNNISFGLNASTLTASVATSLTAVNLSAGTTSQNLSALVFSNSNNVSFGLNGSTVTASATVASTQGSFNLSAGTTSNLASAFTFSNSNGVSFGLNASTLTASVATSLTNINVSAGTTSQNLSALTFSNSNGVSFGLNGSIVTASVVPGGGGGIAAAAGTQTATSGTVVFSNSNGFTFGMSNSSVVTIATSAGNITASNEAVFASEVSNTPSAGAATINWKSGNKQTVTLNAATVTLSFTAPDGPCSVTLRVVQDGSGSRLVAWTGSGLVINWVGGVVPTLSTAAGAVDIVSLYWNGTAWYGSYGIGFGTSVVAVPVLTNINVSAGTTSQNLSALTFSNSNGVSFGLNGSIVTASAAGGGGPALAAGTQTATSGTVVFSNSNGVTFGMSNSSVVTASHAINVSAGTTSQNLSALVFSNSNGLSFGLNGSTITASDGDYAFAAGTQTATVQTGTIVFSNSNGVSFGMSGSSQITASVATSLTNINVSAGTTSNNLSAVVFSNSNGVSFGLNGSTITATVTPGPSAGIAAIAAGTQTATSGTIVFSNSNGVSFGLSGSTQLTASIAGFTRSRFNPFMEAVAVTGQHGNGSLHLHPIPDPDNWQMDRLIFDLNFSMANTTATSTGGGSYSVWAGFYTRNVSTLSLLASSSSSTAWTYGSANTASVMGGRIFSIGWTTTISKADIWLGIVSSTSSSGNIAYTLSQYVVSDVNSNFSGNFGVASNASVQDRLGLGYYSAATGGIPASIAFTDMRGTASMALRPPLYAFLSQSA